MRTLQTLASRPSLRKNSRTLLQLILSDSISVPELSYTLTCLDKVFILKSIMRNAISLTVCSLFFRKKNNISGQTIN